MAAAADQARARADELAGAQADAGHALAAAAGGLDPACRGALTELVQAWGILGAQLAATSGALATSLAASADRYQAAERALAGSFSRGALGTVRA